MSLMQKESTFWGTYVGVRQLVSVWMVVMLVGVAIFCQQARVSIEVAESLSGKLLCELQPKEDWP
eukprot:3777660-Amphidinium_carterae.1